MAQRVKCSRCGLAREISAPALPEQQIGSDAVMTASHVGQATVQSRTELPTNISLRNAPPNAGGCGELAMLLVIFFSSNAILIRRGNDTGTNLGMLLISLLLTTAAGAIMARIKKSERRNEKAREFCAECTKVFSE